ncbi:unnamed protein product [Musa acuminata subsp. malaccensis]|nr:PREDICTED: uncharacterized protein LOC103982098 [Musa acuminata subsp. malaccensis]CAG1844796.1 unnamed protein product [Musa acuminata subsp. malaccensis]
MTLSSVGLPLPLLGVPFRLPPRSVFAFQKPNFSPNHHLLLLRQVENKMASSSSFSSSCSWTCNRCTFVNPPSQKSSCQICLSPIPIPSSLPSSSSSSVTSEVFRWSCRACTFSNPADAAACEVCGTTAALPSPSSASRLASLLSDLEPEPHELAHPDIGRVFLPLLRCGAKRPPPSTSPETKLRRAATSHKLPRAHEEQQKQQVAVNAPSPALGNVGENPKRCIIKILSYNVWFREDLELRRRMQGLGDLIEQNSPDFICLQEVTPSIYEIFQESNWLKHYKCSVPQHLSTERPYFCMQMSKLPMKGFSCIPFTNSVMGRELCLADIDVGGSKKLIVATSHLESPCPAPPRWDQMYSKERVAQAKEAINLLKDSPNAIFAGDMNWDDKLDGAFPLPDGWIDAWLELRPGENGWTYDTKANQMLSGNRTLQKRLDRFMCNLHDFKVDGIEMIGVEAIPGLSYCKEKKVRKVFKKLVLPVLPSDHYGLLLTISSL